MTKKKKILLSISLPILALLGVGVGLLCYDLYMNNVKPLFDTLQWSVNGLKNEAKKIMDSISTQKTNLDKIYYQTINRESERIPFIPDNQTNLYNISLDSSYAKYAINGNLYLKFNATNSKSLNENTIINFNKSVKLMTQQDLQFFESINSISIELHQKNNNSTNFTYLINFNNEAFTMFSNVKKFSIFNSSDDYLNNDNWVNNVDKNSLPTSLVDFYCEPSFYLLRKECDNSWLFNNLPNLRKFIFNGQIYTNQKWYDENTKELVKPYLYSNQYYADDNSFTNCYKDLKIYSTVTYGFKDQSEKNDFLSNVKNFKRKRIPMYFDYYRSNISWDWAFPPFPDNPFDSRAIYFTYSLDYWYSKQTIRDPSIPPNFNGKYFSGFYINRKLFNEFF